MKTNNNSKFLFLDYIAVAIIVIAFLSLVISDILPEMIL